MHSGQIISGMKFKRSTDAKERLEEEYLMSICKIFENVIAYHVTITVRQLHIYCHPHNYIFMYCP